LRTQRGKRRSLGQRIGEKGEALFAVWATDHHLSPNKVAHDYGVDYFCQIMRPAGTEYVEESTGAILAVQVRSTQGRSRPRVFLTRTDAVDLLRQTHPTCLVAIHAPTPSVHFLFRDESMVAKLQDFLASDRETLSFPLGKMLSDGAEFERLVDYHARPGTQHRLQIHHAQLELARVLPGASLSIQQDADGGLALLPTPMAWFRLSDRPGDAGKSTRSSFAIRRIPRAASRGNDTAGDCQYSEARRRQSSRCGRIRGQRRIYSGMGRPENHGNSRAPQTG
jgi:hypothetical protein